MIAQRTLAIIAAILLVVAVAVATFGPQSMTLGQALYLIDHDLLNRLPVWSRHAVGDWVWTAFVQPLLGRPAWLIPASISLICVGLSLSLSNRKAAHRSHRRS